MLCKVGEGTTIIPGKFNQFYQSNYKNNDPEHTDLKSILKMMHTTETDSVTTARLLPILILHGTIVKAVLPKEFIVSHFDL